MELGDVQVVDPGPRSHASALLVQRRVRRTIETARAYSARNRRDDALGVLLAAKHLAPERFKHHAISCRLVLLAAEPPRRRGARGRHRGRTGW